jgi:hypothetical protein
MQGLFPKIKQQYDTPLWTSVAQLCYSPLHNKLHNSHSFHLHKIKANEMGGASNIKIQKMPTEFWPKNLTWKTSM